MFSTKYHFFLFNSYKSKLPTFLSSIQLTFFQHCNKSNTIFMFTDFAGSTSEAVHIKKITEVVRASNKFRHVVQQQIRESLEKLVQSSELYKQSDNEYCLVCSPHQQSH